MNALAELDFGRFDPASGGFRQPTRAPVLAPELRVAVLIPCHNEEATVGDVVGAFARALPGAEVFVYDNLSTDGTELQAELAGAVLRSVPLKGKGNVVRRMFADVDADVYLLVDGDGTYDAAAAPEMIHRLLVGGLDMVCGARVSSERAAFRAGHRLGNRLLTGAVARVFGRQFRDMLTGYRVFSRRFVKSFPGHSVGFEIETELTIHALKMRLPVAELDTAYASRPEGSASKLNTLWDGLQIARTIGLLIREELPLQFFSCAAALALLGSAALSTPVVITYLRDGLVPRFPTLIVSVGLVVVALLSFASGLILDAVSRSRLEQRRFAYLAVPAPPTGMPR